MEAQANRLRAGILAQTGDAIVAVDHQQRVTFLNAAAERLYGITAAEAIGHPLSGVFEIHWLRPEDQAAAETALRQHGQWRGETLHLKRNGAAIHTEVSASRLHAEDGSSPGRLFVIRDISGRRQEGEALWESSQMLKLVLANMPAFVFWKDRHSLYLGCNDLFAANAGLNSPEEIIGMSDLDLPWKHDEAESYRADDRRVMETGIPKLYYEETQHTADGRVTWVRTSKIPLRNPDGDIIGVLGTFEDITGSKQAEEQIRQLNEVLELRVVERTLDLRAAVNALETEIVKRQRLEHEILKISEHEQRRLGQDLHDGLGQELAGIAMIGKVLADELQAESHPAATAAENIATYIRETIDSARRLAKGLYPIELAHYGLLHALEDLASQTSRRFGICCELHKSGKELELEESAEIHIYRIVQECIGNAIRHGKANRITIESLAGDGVHTFRVIDDGLGFERSPDNTGMGLHLMNYRARVIGGELAVERPETGGCRVTCRLSV